LFIDQTKRDRKLQQVTAQIGFLTVWFLRQNYLVREIWFRVIRLLCSRS